MACTALPPSDLPYLLDVLFETVPLYQDRDSRRAAERVLVALANSPCAAVALPAVVAFLERESVRGSIAHADACVLAHWSAVLLQQFASGPEQWSKWGLRVAVADAKLLATCMSACDSQRVRRVQHSAIISTRRALRAVFRSEQIGTEALDTLVATLTAKGTASTAGHAVLLGVIAGVSSRLPTVKPRLEGHKAEYYTFYVREIISSKGPLPSHLSNALHDFFDSFPTLQEVQTEILPPIEKALLRAPEVVLNDIVSPMILALPVSMDLSDVFYRSLLKPLLSNVKSTNPMIRAGALRTFQALGARSLDDNVIGNIADEVLAPLKQGKTSGVDQKVLHAQMLMSLSGSVSLAERIPASIATIALKEPNEAAVIAQVATLTKHLTFGLANGVSLDKSISDAFVQGMADKRVPIRRLWSIRAADIWWNLSIETLPKSDIQAFCYATLPKLVEIWQDVVTNPVPATQSGMVTVGHYVTALLVAKVRGLEDTKLAALYKKTDVISQSLAIQSRPSFLLNPRVYTKLSVTEDIHIALRALTAVAPSVFDEKLSQEAKVAWSQALIYFSVAQGNPPEARASAREALTNMYLQSPIEFTRVIISGLWAWYKSNERGEKDSAAIAAKSGTDELHLVLSSFCLPKVGLKKMNAIVPEDVLSRQCVELLVLARSDLLPRISWIDLCLKIGVDPGQLVRSNLEECLELANEATTVMAHCVFISTKTDGRNRTKTTVIFLQLPRRLTMLSQTWLLLPQMSPYHQWSNSLAQTLIRNN
jgi:hypothetical protein